MIITCADMPLGCTLVDLGRLDSRKEVIAQLSSLQGTGVEVEPSRVYPKHLQRGDWQKDKLVARSPSNEGTPRKR
jgi:hypothetical protein